MNKHYLVMILTYCSLSIHICHFGLYQMCSDCILIAWSLFNILQSVEYNLLFHFWMLESTNPRGMQSSQLQMDLCKTTSKRFASSHHLGFQLYLRFNCLLLAVLNNGFILFIRPVGRSLETGTAQRDLGQLWSTQ